MSWLNTKRVLRGGAQSFFRNGFVTFSSVVVLTITLFIIASTLLLGGFLNYELNGIREKVDVNVHFLTSASETDILSVKKSLEALPEVVSVEYISKDQELANFRATHSGDESILQGLDELGENPLGAVLNIKAKDPSQYGGIANYLEKDSNELLSSNGSKIIDKVSYKKPIIDKLVHIINSADAVGFWLALIFIVISIIITFNTIKLTIFMAKDEISVMRLVGASGKYVKGPFVVTGVLSGLISAFLIIVLISIGTFFVNKYYGNYFVGFDLFSYYMSNFFYILAVVFGSGIILGSVSSYLAVHRYLDK